MFMFACMPVRWNIGSTPSPTASLELGDQVQPPMQVAMRFECVSMQPFGSPVVPDV
jgi:hypothetical protein